jgi:hypothetical protein
MRRTRFSLVPFLGLTAVFLTGCLVGAGLQYYSLGMQTAPTVALMESAAPNSGEPLTNRLVRTFTVRADGSFLPPETN